MVLLNPKVILLVSKIRTHALSSKKTYLCSSELPTRPNCKPLHKPRLPLGGGGDSAARSFAARTRVATRWRSAVRTPTRGLVGVLSSRMPAAHGIRFVGEIESDAASVARRPLHASLARGLTPRAGPRSPPPRHPEPRDGASTAGRPRRPPWLPRDSADSGDERFLTFATDGARSGSHRRAPSRPRLRLGHAPAAPALGPACGPLASPPSQGPD